MRLVLVRMMLLLLVAATGPQRPVIAQEPVAFERSALVIETAAGARYPFEVELALTPEQQARGLMFRDSLAPDAGMLFVFERPRHAAFWMRNTLIPLDMLFLREDGTVVRIAERTEPLSEESVPSGQPVKAVLEITGGLSAQLGIRPGDRVLHRLLDADDGA